MLTLSFINLMFISIHFCLEDVKLHSFALNQFRLLGDRPNKGNEKPLTFDLNFSFRSLNYMGDICLSTYGKDQVLLFQRIAISWYLGLIVEKLAKDAK